MSNGGLKPGDEWYEEQRFFVNERLAVQSKPALIAIINGLLDITDGVEDKSFTCDDEELQEILSIGNGEQEE